MPPALVEKIQHSSYCLQNAGGMLLAATRSCITDFSRRLCRTENAVRYIALYYGVFNDGIHTLWIVTSELLHDVKADIVRAFGK